MGTGNGAARRYGRRSGRGIGFAAAWTVGLIAVAAALQDRRSPRVPENEARPAGLRESTSAAWPSVTLAPITHSGRRAADVTAIAVESKHASDPATISLEPESLLPSDTDLVTIRGRFIDARGNPIAGAVATWLDPESGRGGTTGPDGTLELRCARSAVPIAVLEVDDGVHAPAFYEWRLATHRREIDLGDEKLADPVSIDVRVLQGEYGPALEGWTVTASYRQLLRGRAHRSAQVDGRTLTAGLERLPALEIVNLSATHPSGAQVIGQHVVVGRESDRRFDLHYSGPDPAQRIGLSFVTGDARRPPAVDPATIRLESDGLVVATAIGEAAPHVRFENIVDRPHVLVLDDPRFEPRRIENVRPGSTVEIELVDRR